MVKKGMKRFLVLGVLGLFFVSMMAGVLGETHLGETQDAEGVGKILGEGVGKFGKFIVAFFDALFGDTLLGGKIFSQIFMALLVGMFVYSALGTVFTNKWVLNLATIAATGLTILGLPKNFLESVLTGYGAMGTAILMIVPFLIIFWFTVKVKSIMIARGIWLFYTVYYFGMYIQELFRNYSQVWPNLIAIILGIIMFFFILGVRGFIFKGEMEKVEEKGKQKVDERKHRLALEMERLKADG